MKTKLCSTIAAALVLGAAIAAPARAADKIRFIIFQSSSALASYVAEDHGFFKKHGLDVTITPTPSSTYMMTNLIDGKYDIASAAIDNFIAYNEGQTKAKTEKKPDLVVFMGITTQNLPVIATSDIKTFADLRGKPVGVDAPNTAFAFVLYKILELNGLKMSDYKIEALGGTTKRWEAMKAGKVKAAVISGAYAALAPKFGMHRLADSQKVIGTYQGSSLGVQRGWLASHRKDAVAFVSANLEALAWAVKNQAAAAKSLQKRIKGLNDEAALKTVARVTSGKVGGLTLDGKIDQKGLKTVVALREQYGKPKKNLGDPMRFVDTSILADAKKK
jgi:ABC-type nitrate/sulfonate/bicarbonate transport system substrate-binding protein